MANNTTGRTTKPKQATKGTKAKTSKAPVKESSIVSMSEYEKGTRISAKPEEVFDLLDTGENKPTEYKRSRGNPAMYQETTEESKERTRKKMLILSKLNELERRRGIPKFDDAEDMQMLIDNYFSDCVDLEIRPTIRGLASALGTTYNTLSGWENGERDGKLGNSCSLIIKKAKQFIAEFDEMLAMEGIDNAILFMFRAKNYYGMRDLQDIQLTANTQLQPTMSMQEIADKVAKDVVIDTDYSE